MTKTLFPENWSIRFYLLVLLCAIQASATIRTWSAASAGNWNVAANWSGSTVPTSSDTARFDATSTQNCAITANPNVNRIEINSGYTGTITQNSGVAVTVGAGGYTQAAGTFTASVDTLFMGGSFTLSGGTFSSGSGTVKVNGNPVTLNTGSETLNNLVFTPGSGGTTTITGNVKVSGTLVFTNAGNINGDTLAASGNVISTDDGSDPIYDGGVNGTAKVLFTGSGSQTLGANGHRGALPSMRINKSGGTLTIQDTIKIPNLFTWSAGTVNHTGTLILARSNGYNPAVNSGTMTFNNVIIAEWSGDILTVTGTMDVNGYLDIRGSGTVNGGTITVAGNLITNDGSLSGTCNLTLDGTTDQTITSVAAGDWPDGGLTINKASGTAFFGSGVKNLSSLTITSGTLDQANYSLRTLTGGTVTVGSSGVWKNIGTGNDTLGGDVSNSGTINFDGTAAGCGDADGIYLRSNTAGTQRTWSGSGAFTIKDVDIKDQAGSATITAHSSTNSGNNGSNWTINSTCPPTTLKTWDGGGSDNNWNTAANWGGDVVPTSNDTAVFDNTSTKNCTVNVDPNVKRIEINTGYTGTVSQAVGVAITLGTGGYSQAAGTFTADNAKITTSGHFSLSGGTFTSTSDTLFMAGASGSSNLTVSGGTFTHNAGKIAFTGGSGTLNTGSAALNHLVLNTQGNLTVTGTVTVAGNLVIKQVNAMDGGTFSVSGNVVSIAASTSTPMNTVVLMTGTANQTLGGAGTNARATLPAIQINKTGGTLTLQDSLRVAGPWTYTAGTVNPGTSTVTFWDGSFTMNSGTMAFNHVVFATPGNMTISGTMTINGNLTINSANVIDQGTLAVAGNVINNATTMSTPRTSAITLNGTGAQAITSVAGAVWPTGTFTVNKSAGVATLGSNISGLSALTITSGELNQGASYSLRVDGAVTVGAAGVWTNIGTGNDTLGGSVSSSGTITFDGTAAGCGDADAIHIQSTVSGTQRAWSGSGVFAIQDVDVKDQAGSADISVSSGTSSGNNGSNWVFNPACLGESDDGGIVIFVSPSGSNVAGDGSLNAPYATLNFAFAQIPSGTLSSKYSIHLLEGRYDLGSGFVVDGKQFTSANTFTLKSHYIDYDQRAVLFTSGSVTRLIELKSSHLIFDKLRFVGGPSCQSALFTSQTLSNLTIQNCLFNFDPDADGNQLTGAALDFTYTGNSISSVKILNNVFLGRDNKGGIGVHFKGTNVQVVNNTFYRLSGAMQVVDVSDVSSIAFNNNIVLSLNYGALELVNCGGTLSVRNSLAYHHGTAVFVQSSGGAAVNLVNTIAGHDPKILSFNVDNPLVGVLFDDSPCKNQGLASGAPVVDFFGKSRPLSSPSIGATDSFLTQFTVPEVHSFVSADGSDNNDGLSEVTAFATLQHAFDALPGGMADKKYAIHVVKGNSPYSAGFSADFKRQFGSLFPLVIQAADLQRKPRFEVSQATIMGLGSVKYVTLSGLEFKCLGLPQDYTQNKAVRGSDNGLMGKADHATVTQCLFLNESQNQMEGIFGLGDSAIITNNIFYSTHNADADRAIEQSYGGKSYQVVNNTFLGSWRYALFMDSLNGTLFTNNIVKGDGVGWVFQGNGAVLSASANNFYYQLSQYPSNGMVGNPFINENPADSQFCLPEEGSPVVNTGYVGLSLVKDDYYGAGRVKTPDIGAVENTGVTQFVFYVDPINGNDNNSGRTTTAPLNTMQAAWNKITFAPKLEEHIIYLFPGEYTGQTLVLDGDKQFNDTATLTIQSLFPSNSQRPRIVVGGSSPGINVKLNDHITINALVFKGAGGTPNNAIVGEYTTTDKADYITVSRCDFIAADTAKLYGIKDLGDNAIVKFNAFVAQDAIVRNDPASVCVKMGLNNTNRGTNAWAILHNSTFGWHTFLNSRGYLLGIFANNIFESVTHVFDFDNSVSTLVKVENCVFWDYRTPTVRTVVVNSQNTDFEYFDTLMSTAGVISWNINDPHYGYMNLNSKAAGFFKPYPNFYSGDHNFIEVQLIGFGNPGAFRGARAMKFYSYGAGGNVVAEYDVTGFNATRLNHINFPGGIGSRGFEELTANVIQSGEDHYYLKDHLGNTRVVFRELDGTPGYAEPIEVLDYYPFGKEHEAPLVDYGLLGTHDRNVTERFGAKEFDDDGADEGGAGNGMGIKGIGLNYFGARYYDPEVGRWISVDPVEQYWSSYSYSPRPNVTYDPDGSLQIDKLSEEDQKAVTSSLNDIQSSKAFDLLNVFTERFFGLNLWNDILKPGVGPELILEKSLGKGIGGEATKTNIRIIKKYLSNPGKLSEVVVHESLHWGRMQLPWYKRFNLNYGEYEKYYRAPAYMSKFQWTFLDNDPTAHEGYIGSNIWLENQE